MYGGGTASPTGQWDREGVRVVLGTFEWLGLLHVTERVLAWCTVR